MRNPDFERIGRRLFAENLVGANFGNMSVRNGADGFFITRTGEYLDTPGEIIFVPTEGDATNNVSSEYRVHRAVYKKCAHAAIVHAHPPFAVAVSLLVDKVIQKDREGGMFSPIIRVVKGRPGTDELAEHVARCLAVAPVVYVRGHGTFAAGKTLDEAYVLTSHAEHSCQILAHIECFNKEKKNK